MGITRWSALAAAGAVYALGAASSGVAQLPATDGAFAAVSVRDLDASIDWYTATLGFEVSARGENEHRRGALLDRDGFVLELAEFPTAVARDELRAGIESHEVHGIFKIGFTTGDLDATFAALEQSGVDVFFRIVNTSDGRRTFGIRDPEGNIIQFVGD